MILGFLDSGRLLNASENCRNTVGITVVDNTDIVQYLCDSIEAKDLINEGELVQHVDLDVIMFKTICRS